MPTHTFAPVIVRLFEIFGVCVLPLDWKLLKDTWTLIHRCSLLGHNQPLINSCYMKKWMRAIVLKFGGHQDHPGSGLKHRSSDSWGWDPRLCISNGFPDGPGTSTLRTTQYWEALPQMCSYHGGPRWGDVHSGSIAATKQLEVLKQSLIFSS